MVRGWCEVWGDGSESLSEGVSGGLNDGVQEGVSGGVDRGVIVACTMYSSLQLNSRGQGTRDRKCE